MIGEMNRRIVIVSGSATTDAGGGLTYASVGTYTIWAKVEDRSGSYQNANRQTVWSYDYKITVRYETSRVIKSNMTVIYDGKRLKINEVSIENEGKRKFAILRCSAIDNNV